MGVAGVGGAADYGWKVEKKSTTGLNKPSVDVPRAVTPAMITVAMKATKMPYSTAVAPRSGFHFLTPRY